MSANLSTLLDDDPRMWIDELPRYQSAVVTDLLAKGRSYEEIAALWLTATAENTYRFGAKSQSDDKGTYLSNLKRELRAYLCGDSKYENERQGLFGEKAATRTFVVSALAVGIAPHIGMAAPVLAPIIALLLASIGKVTLNAWCETTSV